MKFQVRGSTLSHFQGSAYSTVVLITIITSHVTYIYVAAFSVPIVAVSNYVLAINIM